jgi:hypothetical protein
VEEGWQIYIARRTICIKYDQIVSVHDAAITVLPLSGAQLRRNMQLADILSKMIEAKHL